jgi:hypothetical protein
MPFAKTQGSAFPNLFQRVSNLLDESGLETPFLFGRNLKTASVECVAPRLFANRINDSINSLVTGCSLFLLLFSTKVIDWR